MLSDAGISAALHRGDITIDPFEMRNLQPASYDVRLGHRAIIARMAHTGLHPGELADVMKLNDGDEIKIPPLGLAFVLTLERLSLTQRYACNIGSRSLFARRGIILIAGLQIDPGFEGNLVLGLANYSQREYPIPFGDPVAMLQFFEVHPTADGQYNDRYDHQHGFSEEDSSFARSTVTVDTQHLFDAVEALRSEFAALQTRFREAVFPLLTGRHLAIYAAFYGLIIALIAGIAGWLASRLVG